METIVAAALRIELAPIPHIENEAMVFSKPKPARHHHLIHQVAGLIGRPVSPDEQGFLTNEGRYVSRRQAYHIARLSGQIPFEERIIPTPGTEKIFSEDLW